MADLSTRNKRSKIKPAKSITWVKVGVGLGIGYRKVSHSKAGTFYVRRYMDGRYHKRSMASADDLPHIPSDGVLVMSYAEAVESAASFDPKSDPDDPGLLKTVDEVLDAYLEWAQSNLKTADYVAGLFNNHVRAPLGGLEVSDLTTLKLERWKSAMASKPALLRGGHSREATTPDEIQSRKASTNVVLGRLKAALNRAWANGQLACSDEQWRRCKPFPKTHRKGHRGRQTFITADEAKRFLDSIEHRDFFNLAKAGLLTGARIQELANITAKDVDLANGILTISQSKTTPREVYLGDQAVALFKGLVADRDQDDLLLKNGNRPWAHSSHQIYVERANQLAGTNITFHSLRHSWASNFLMSGGSRDALRRQGGWASMAMIDQHYGHLTDDHRRDQAIRYELPLDVDKQGQTQTGTFKQVH
jgi:integrase/recombinase XerD